MVANVGDSRAILLKQNGKTGEIHHENSSSQNPSCAQQPHPFQSLCPVHTTPSRLTRKLV